MNIATHGTMLDQLWGYDHYLEHVNSHGSLLDYKLYLMTNVGDEQDAVNPKDILDALNRLPWRRITAGLHDLLVFSGSDADCMDGMDITWMNVARALDKAVSV